jgi:hypothetical protein
LDNHCGNWDKKGQAIEIVLMHKMSTERARTVKQLVMCVLRLRSDFMTDTRLLVRASSDLKLINVKSSERGDKNHAER